jgi:uncharacterized damage-inducible protein DinB
MDKNEILINYLQSIHGATKKLLDDISEEESMYQGHSRLNHIKWQTGHLVNSAGIVLKLLGAEAGILPEWEKLFEYNSELQTSSEAYPDFSDLRTKLYELYDKTLEVLQTRTNEDLEQKVKYIANREEVLLDAILWLGAHDFYHAGQITATRKMLGRDRPFG